jgi:hypothetical protein
MSRLSGAYNHDLTYQLRKLTYNFLKRSEKYPKIRQMGQIQFIGKYPSLKTLKSHIHRVAQTINFIQKFKLFL